MRSVRRWPFVLLASLVVVLFVLQLFVGSVDVVLGDVWAALTGGKVTDQGHRAIVLGIRLPQAITGLCAGAGLAVSGLLMQTLFRNPLAGPSVLGISSGSSLGVALVLLSHPLWSTSWLPPDIALVVSAWLGAMGVLVLILFADRRVGDGVTLLIVGLLIGYLCSALISVLEVASPAGALKGFVLWGMGSFAGVGMERLGWLVVPVIIGSALALLSIKSLNALLLGEDYAATMGVAVRPVRRRLMVITGILAGTITAFCGPIAFLGMVVPHVARGMFRTGDHAVLVPATLLCGAAGALLCDLLARGVVPGSAIPLNAVTSMLGVPVVAWILFTGKRWSRTA